MADEVTIDPSVAPEEPVETAPEGTDAVEQDAPAVDPAELDRLRAALAKANKEAEKNRLRLKEVDDEKLSEVERAKRDAEEATRELDKLRKDSLRKTVALNAGLPAKWVSRLQGDSEEELAADAAEILADLNKTRKPAPDPSQGPRTSPISEEDKLYESIYGSRKA